jgi:hypothetical protein
MKLTALLAMVAFTRLGIRLSLPSGIPLNVPCLLAKDGNTRSLLSKISELLRRETSRSALEDVSSPEPYPSAGPRNDMATSKLVPNNSYGMATM